MSRASDVRDIVLVVDDSPETLSLLTDALEMAGSTVLVATGGEQALGLCERITPDIILMDAVMPGINGFETCRRLKASGGLASVPVIFMTALSEPEHVVRGFEAGGVDYVTKPIVIEVLMARLRVHLANARAAQDARSALDAAGRFLLATDREGLVNWSTPQALKLLGHTKAPPAGSPEGTIRLPREVLDALLDGAAAADTSIEVGSRRVAVSLVSRLAQGEYLLRLSSAHQEEPMAILRRRFSLTAREAEVLLWLGRGKSNRDIAEILGLSPRTVNKHLEQVFAKLGVENRASAAVLANRITSD
jgi:DNA-binding NarL/FixJ family response regulator